MIEGVRALDFGDDEGMIAQRVSSPAHRCDVVAGLDKGLADRVNSFFRGELQAFMVTFGEGADSEIYAGEIQSLAGPQLSARNHPAENLIALDRRDIELNYSIIQKERVAGPDRLRQSLEGDRGPPCVSDNIVDGQYKRISGLQFHGLLREVSDAHLGAGKVSHDREPLSRGTGRCSQVPHHRAVAVKSAVREIEAGDVHACLYHPFHDPG